MELFDDPQQLFAGLQPLARPTDHEQSDSEDEIGLSSLADHDNYSLMNIPESMKNILRMNPDGKDIDSTQDDSESDNDSIYKVPAVSIERLNTDIARNKFLNFPLMPPQDNEPEVKKKTQKKPKEKKKKRDKGKKNMDIMEPAQDSKSKNLDKLLANFVKFANEHDSDEEADTPKKKKSKGRKTRKEEKSNALMVDENGERLIRATEFLGTDSDESSDEERALSKARELEMYKESERLRRAGNARLKPVYNLKSFDQFVKRQDEREAFLLSQLEISSQQIPKNMVQPTKSQQDDFSDDDLIIVNNPTNLASMMSPDRNKNPISNWSPVKQASVALRTHNKSMLSRITNEGYAYRMKMEQDAKARGQFSSATERAKKLLEKEKSALMINAQIKMHFERNNQNDDDDDDEVDEDYQEDEEEEVENDYLNQLSGQDEDEDEEEDISTKRKIDHGESEEEDDMGTMAMNRWKSKKVRKSIFDDSDDDEDVELKKKVVPVPAHSISNFFKAKVILIQS